jgi:hypothetical protein
MKKPIVGTDKYKSLIDKNKKAFIPNLKSTDEYNEKAYRIREEQAILSANPNINFNPHLVSHDKTKKLSLIIPYRDRKHHLNEFLNTVPLVLDSQNIDYNITVIEQEDGKLFNKGILNNIGFLQTSECDYFCFHDVDMMPIAADYGYLNNGSDYFGMAIHLAKLVEQFEYKELANYFGGVLLLDKVAFKLINGYSISYWGWGLEDDDFYRRCLSNNRVVVLYREGVFRSLKHKSNYNEHLYYKNFDIYRKNISQYSDGLAQTKYNIVSKKKLNEKTTIITVSI